MFFGTTKLFGLSKLEKKNRKREETAPQDQKLLETAPQGYECQETAPQGQNRQGSASQGQAVKLGELAENRELGSLQKTLMSKK